MMSSSSSSSSSSTPGGSCVFAWDAVNNQWVLQQNNCQSGFVAPSPQAVLTTFGPGTMQGQTVMPSCVRPIRGPGQSPPP